MIRLISAFGRQTLAGLLIAGLLGATLPAPGGAQERIVVRTEAGTPMVATEVLLSTGPADETAEDAGLAYLAARAVIQPIRPLLEEMGASLRVDAYKDAMTFTLLAAPDAWHEATRTLLVALFRDPVDSLAVDLERQAIQSELQGRAANPADALALEVDRAFWGIEHPWGRPEVGTAETVQRLSAGTVDAFLRQHYGPERALVITVGPISARDATEHLAPLLGEEIESGPWIQQATPAQAPVLRDYNSITTWVAASYRFHEGADIEALRMLTHLVTEAVSYGSARPMIYNARGEIFPRAAGGEIRFQLVVPPGLADDWAERLQAAVAQFSRRALPREAFVQSLRSYRGARLLELNAPEARAREIARTVYLGGSVPEFAQFETLSAERLRAAARSLDAPVLVLLGPAVTRGEE